MYKEYIFGIIVILIILVMTFFGVILMEKYFILSIPSISPIQSFLKLSIQIAGVIVGLVMIIKVIKYLKYVKKQDIVVLSIDFQIKEVSEGKKIPKQNEMVICSNCKHKTPDRKICYYCGSEIKKTETLPHPESVSIAEPVQTMPCWYHPERPSITECQHCTAFICESCANTMNEQIFCPICQQGMIASEQSPIEEKEAVQEEKITYSKRVKRKIIVIVILIIFLIGIAIFGIQYFGMMTLLCPVTESVYHENFFKMNCVYNYL